MGLLVDGKWHSAWYDTKKSGGNFERSKAAFRNWVTQDGSAGATGRAGFKAEPGRYHLYVSWACPWAHRTLIFRELKGLSDMISLSAVNSYMPDETGWSFLDGDDVIKDPIIDAEFMHQIYTHAKNDYSGRVTVPVLWCKKNASRRRGISSVTPSPRPTGGSLPPWCVLTPSMWDTLSATKGDSLITKTYGIIAKNSTKSRVWLRPVKSKTQRTITT